MWSIPAQFYPQIVSHSFVHRHVWSAAWSAAVDRGQHVPHVTTRHAPGQAKTRHSTSKQTNPEGRNWTWTLQEFQCSACRSWTWLLDADQCPMVVLHFVQKDNRNAFQKLQGKFFFPINLSGIISPLNLSGIKKKCLISDNKIYLCCCSTLSRSNALSLPGPEGACSPKWLDRITPAYFLSFLKKIQIVVLKQLKPKITKKGRVSSFSWEMPSLFACFSPKITAHAVTAALTANWDVLKDIFCSCNIDWQGPGLWAHNCRQLQEGYYLGSATLGRKITGGLFRELFLWQFGKWMWFCPSLNSYNSFRSLLHLNLLRLITGLKSCTVSWSNFQATNREWIKKRNWQKKVNFPPK